ncbi:MAG: hypothetical protein ABSH28_17240, partial [Acidobacteriota bacterium]
MKQFVTFAMMCMMLFPLSWFGEAAPLAMHSAGGPFTKATPTRPALGMAGHFDKARALLLEANIPFDPDMLLAPHWQLTLVPFFARMPEMMMTRYNYNPLRGVILADTLHLPEKAAVADDIVVIARELLFDGENAEISGPHNIYLFVFGAIGVTRGTGHLSHGGTIKIAANGLGRKEWLANQQTQSHSRADLSAAELRRPMPIHPDAGCTYCEENGKRGTDGSNGNNGSSGANGGAGGPGQNGTCGGSSSNGDNGVNGGNGLKGGKGVSGENGTAGEDGQLIATEATCASSHITLESIGGDGGNGGNGGSGGQGGTGGPGGSGGAGADCVCNQ